MALMTVVRRFLCDERGATAIEYCFIASIVSIAIFAALQAIGPKLNTRFTNISGALN